MASIEVDPDEVTALGNELKRLATFAEPISAALPPAGSVPAPHATAEALTSLAGEWQAAARSLEDELSTLGQDALMAAFLYTQTEGEVIPVEPPG